MLIEDLKIWWHQGRQYIPDLEKAAIPAPFRGRPEISSEPITADEEADLVDLCPTGAISGSPLRIDLMKCTFCGECAHACPRKIRFTQDHRLATNEPEKLVIREGVQAVSLDPDKVRQEIHALFGRSLKLRQISAAGDNSYELELNACSNVNFDMGRFGIEFVSSPRHADGIVITGPISENMAKAMKIAYDAVPEPKLVILVGVDALSGGIFAGSPALQRQFLQDVPIDLYVPGNPPHPLTFIQGILDLIR